MYIVIGIVILAVLYSFYLKFKNSVHNAKDASLVKKDQALATKQDEVKARLEELKKVQHEATNMTPEEIENFWGKK